MAEHTSCCGKNYEKYINISEHGATFLNVVVTTSNCCHSLAPL